MDLETYDDLVEAIYAAPFEDSGWHLVVSKLLGLFHSTPAIACRNEPENTPIRTPPDYTDGHRGELFDVLGDSANLPGIQRYRNLSRHIRKAVQIGNRVERISSSNSVFEVALDHLRLGIVFLDRNAHIHKMNAYAKRLIERNSELIAKASRLELSQKKQRDIFHRALTGDPVPGTNASFSLPRHRQSPLCLCITPIPDRSEHNPGEMILFISDPDDREEVDSSALAKRWNLTTLEGEVVLLMLKGLTLKQIAARLELTENTARWYSKQIMGKIGVKRQAELNARLMKDIAFLIHMEKPDSLA